MGTGSRMILTARTCRILRRHFLMLSTPSASNCRSVAKLPPDQLARFHRWLTEFEAGGIHHTKELDSAATKLGRLAGRAFAELKKRAKEQ